MPIMEKAELRPAVAWFALLMEHTLRKHDAKKGADGWEGADPFRLEEMMVKEVEEVRLAMRAPNGEEWHQVAPDVVREAADVANMAMMLAHVANNDAHMDEQVHAPQKLERRVYCGIRVVEGPGGVPEVVVEADLEGLAADSAARAVAMFITAAVGSGKQMVYHNNTPQAGAMMWKQVQTYIQEFDAKGPTREEVIRKIF